MSFDIIFYSLSLSDLGDHVLKSFKADRVESLVDLCQKLSEKTLNYRAIVLDVVREKERGLEICQELLADDCLSTLPTVIIATSDNVQDRLRAFEMGCDDFIGSQTTPDETVARINRSIFHQIAEGQLSQQLTQATETAKNAMIDNSDLGANVQFLLKVHQCDNLDQLGQQFFACIRRYGLSCSLQMRSEFGHKDMEENGMAKDLESQLLLQLKDKGRYVDFGRRSIMNYDRVSLLIKNMPVGDPEKYGAIKDNVFSLVQGVDSRILALEDREKLLAEKESLQKLSMDVNDVIGALKLSYQEVMRKIVIEVENASEVLQYRIPVLSLTEADERFIDGVTESLVTNTNQVFNDGLKVDELFGRLESTVQRHIEQVKTPSASSDNLEDDDLDSELF